MGLKIIIAILVGILLVITYQIGFDTGDYTSFMSIIYIAIAAVVVYAIYWWFTKKKRRIEEHGLSRNEVKWIGWKCLKKEYGIDILSRGSNPDNAVYDRTPIIGRVYPAKGTEMWHYRIRVRDPKHFGGLETDILLFIDGAGEVTDNTHFNSDTIKDREMWNKPEQHFKGVSKTREPKGWKERISEALDEDDSISDEVVEAIAKSEIDKELKKEGV